MKVVVNKRALSDYTLLDQFVAGMVLSGAEVKSIRLGHASLTGSYVQIMGNEAFLIGAQVTAYPFAHNPDYDPKRSRKLLFKKNELDKLNEARHEKGLTLVPLSLVVIRNHIKLELAIARGKKQYERRSELKKRTIEREVAREFKHKVSYRG